MSESLRNDGRIWVPKQKDDKRKGADIPEEERDYYLERRYPAFGNLVPRDIASRAAKERCDAGYGVGTSKMAVYLDFSDAIKRLGQPAIEARYGNLFEMYEKITGENPYETPMRIYPAVHYTMGGLWVDYNLMTTVEGLYATGECNFSDHGANRLGASALMQGLADGYFVLPITIGDYLSKDIRTKSIPTDHPEFAKAEKEIADKIQKLMSIQGKQPVDYFHKKLGLVMWEYCGMARNAEGLQKAKKMVQEIRAEFWSNVRIPGSANETNQELEKALRVADFLELGELMIDDAYNRNESCGGHFREEYQTEDGEARRDDENYAYVAAWEFKGEGQQSELHKEELVFDNVKLVQRSYK
jgi:succinate dehydrogenase / fumarate reductase flavoprotein subunit